MNTKEVRLFIENLRSKELIERGFISFHYEDQGDYIVANKDGLKLFALDLLESSLEIENRTFKKNKKEFISLNLDWVSKQSEMSFSFIEFTNKSKAEIEPIKDYKQTWKVTLGGYILGGLLIFILISVLVGAVTIIGWLF